MNSKEEALMKDYIALGVIGAAIGLALGGSVSIGGLFALISSDMGRTAAMGVVTGIFAYLPAAVIAGYLHFTWHKVENKMEGLTVGIMVFLAHLIITLFLTIGSTAIYGGNWGSTMQSWGISIVFALIFYIIGGFLSTIFDGLKMPMMGALKMQRAPSPAPPPPPGATATSTCPTCGGPLRYIQQYQRWYCDKEQKYA